MIYQFRHKGVLIRFAFPPGGGKRHRFDKLLIFLPGLPSYPGQPSFLDAALKLRVGVVMPQYLGSYQSDGIFTPHGCIETVRRTVEFLNRKHGEELYGKTKISWDFSEIILGGTSFGGYAAVESLKYIAFQKLFLVSPLLYLAPTNGLPKLGDPIIHRLEFVKDVYGHVYRSVSISLWKRAMAHFQAGENGRTIVEQTRIAILHGIKDNIVPYQHSKYFSKQHPNVFLGLQPGAGHSTSEVCSSALFTRAMRYLEK